MSNLLSMEFVQALNPLYAFPIVAVILCAFIVYAFGFKSPVQPPSFDGIEEEKKVTKKRKTRDSNKGKAVQNGKINGSAGNKAQVPTTGKKKEAEKSIVNDKPAVEKVLNDKKATKKAKSQGEKKVQERKKKESISHEDAGEDGWVQLISKKERKSRKKDEASSTENQAAPVKSVKNTEVNKSDESSPAKENPLKAEEIVVENSVPEKKQPASKQIKEDKKKEADVIPVSDVENKVVIEVSKSDASNQEKIASKDNAHKTGKLIEETSNKSKKKKKKNAEVINTDSDSIANVPEPSAVQVNSEISSQENAAVDSAAIVETPQVNNGKVEVDQPKESKSSNVAFDELAGLYPEAKEPRKKKKVRRDH